MNPEVVGRSYPPTAPYLVGREKVREFSRAVLASNPVNLDPVAAPDGEAVLDAVQLRLRQVEVPARLVADELARARHGALALEDDGRDGRVWLVAFRGERYDEERLVHGLLVAQGRPLLREKRLYASRLWFHLYGLPRTTGGVAPQKQD